MDALVAGSDIVIVPETDGLTLDQERNALKDKTALTSGKTVCTEYVKLEDLADGFRGDVNRR